MHRLAAFIGAAAALAFIGGSDPAAAQRACSALETQLLQLQAGGIGRGEATRVQRLRRRMARSGCGGGVPNARSAVRSEPRPTRGVIGRTAPRSHALRRSAPAPQGRQAPTSGRTYRTMCVRTCDGYYFPLSFSTTRDRFSDDAAICARMCPEAEVGLYYHAAGEEPADMTSVDGAPYSELPAAFRYRQHFDPDCSCGRPAAEEAGAEGRGEAAEGPAPRFAALPQPRPAPAEDPETLANRQGGFAVAEIEPEAFASARGRFGRPVRQVGPLYGGDPASALLVKPVSR